MGKVTLVGFWFKALSVKHPEMFKKLPDCNVLTIHPSSQPFF